MLKPRHSSKDRVLFSHFYVNGVNPRSYGNKEEPPWNLPLAEIRNLLDVLEKNIYPTFAVIDGYEPVFEIHSLKRFIAFLRLYGWYPVLLTRGIFAVKTNVERTIEELLNAGLSALHIELDPSAIRHLGEEPFLRLYRAAMKNRVTLTTSCCLPADDNGQASATFREFLRKEEFNDIFHNFFLISKQTALHLSQADSFLHEFIVGHKGTLSLEPLLPASLRCNLFANGWSSRLTQCLKELKESHYAAV